MNRSYLPFLQSRWFARALFAAACAFAAFLVLALSFRLAGKSEPAGIYYSIDGFRYASFEDMIYGTAKKPYANRCLVPFTVAVLTQSFRTIAGEERIAKWQTEMFGPADFNPATIERVVTRRGARDPATMEWLFIQHGLIPKNYVGYFAAIAILFFALFAFPYALRFLMHATMRAPPVYASVIAVAALLALPRLMQYVNFLYDFPGLFLFTLALAFMASRQWRPYFILFPFATLNKETTILLILLFAIYFNDSTRMPAREYWRKIGLQAGMWAGVKLLTFVFFFGNAGGAADFTFFKHNYVELLDVLGNFTMGGWIGFLGILFLLFHRWNEKPGFLRAGAWMAAAHILILLFTGWIDEMRIYYEIYGIGVLLAAHSFGKLIGLDIQARDELPFGAAELQ